MDERKDRLRVRRVTLYDRETGYMRTIDAVYYPQYDDGDERIWGEFIWTEGNYSCDCNRMLFLYNLNAGDPYVRCGDSRIDAVLHVW